MASTRSFLEFGIVHRQDGLLSIQIDLKVRAFASFEDRSLLREPTPQLFARHFFIINNIVYIGKSDPARAVRSVRRASIHRSHIIR
jgi:hypothetical protein